MRSVTSRVRVRGSSVTSRVRVRGSSVAIVVVATIAFGTAACKRRAADDPNATASAAPVQSAPRVDQTAPGELAEGTEDAFGLRLPRYLTITARFGDSTFASGPLAPERVANYVRQRVTAKNVDTGPAKTVFTGAEPKGAPGKTLRIEVIARSGSTEIMIRDETRPPDDKKSPAEHLRAVGLKPDGTPLDPTHLQ